LLGGLAENKPEATEVVLGVQVGLSLARISHRTAGGKVFELDSIFSCTFNGRKVKMKDGTTKEILANKIQEPSVW